MCPRGYSSVLYGIISSIWMRTRIKPVPEVSYAQTPATKLRCQKHHFKHSTEKKCKPPFSVGYVIKLMTGAGAEGIQNNSNHWHNDNTKQNRLA
ncbi:hypothetical protein KQX54_012407 [Cotesia glomerata]|uniref:Uncharacterized protein n=1 Tax=Cotesia glomerata TaxID=32391 RepID=A0AAV7IMA9_COTGL|nr:hypothetical protein KQX54_012407 [Cotesia glomerata]